MKLYFNPISTYSQKVLIVLYETGIEFEPSIVDLMDEDARLKYREIYPMGKIPCLQLDDGHIIPESSIIIEYLDGLGEPTFIKGDADETRKIRFKDRMFDHYLNDAVVTLLFQGMKPESEQDPERISQAKHHINTMYSFMENEFSQQNYANGDEFLLADCAAAPALFYAERVAPFSEHENICAYWERLKSRPSIPRTHEEAAPLIAAFMDKN